MADLPQDLTETAGKTITKLAEAFGYAEKMIENEKQIEEDISSGKIKEALHDTRRLLRNFKITSRADNRAVHGDDELVEGLGEIKEYLPEDSADEPAKFIKQLNVASAHLKTLSAFYRGSLREEIKDLQDDEARDKKYHALAEKLPDDKGLQAKLQAADNEVHEAVSKLREQTQDLEKWLQSNTAVVTLIKAWAEKLQS